MGAVQKLPAKGQIKPKADWRAVDSPKTDEFDLFAVKSKIQSKVPYFKHLTKAPYRVYYFEESRENGYFFGINTFIKKKIST